MKPGEMQLLKSIKNNVIVELIEKEKVTSSGIILKSADPAEANKATVVAIGGDCVDVKVGDVVLPNWNAARKMKFDERELFSVKEEEIVLIFED